MIGVEPTCLTAPDPKSGASANFATSAHGATALAFGETTSASGVSALANGETTSASDASAIAIGGTTSTKGLQK